MCKMLVAMQHKKCKLREALGVKNVDRVFLCVTKVFNNGKPTLKVHCLNLMLPLNQNGGTSSLAPPMFCVAK